MEKKNLFDEVGPDGGKYKKGQWQEFAIQDEKEIRGFFGPYRFLSNFWPAKVYMDGVEYKSVELAYQAAKWKSEDRGYFQTCTEKESIKYNRENTPNGDKGDDWHDKKYYVMKTLLLQKFDPGLNPENAKMLLETGDRYLEEMNWWEDRYWGKDNEGNGDNNLGKLLMEIREELKKSTPDISAF